MYVNTWRSSDLPRSSAWQPYAAKSFQRTNSWRTGRRLDGETKSRDFVPNPPIREKGESLGRFIGRRNQYYATIAENLRSQPRYTGHAFTADGGHSFRTAKAVFDYGVYTRIDKSNGSITKGRVIPYLYMMESDFQFVRNGGVDNPLTLGLAEITQADTAIRADFSARTNQDIVGAYTSSIPDAAQYGWGETIVELLRGNFPRAIPDLWKRIQEGRKLDPRATGRSLGSDYLNARFGIEPIIKDVIKLVENLSAVHDNLYDNYKRSRMTEQRSWVQPARYSSVWYPNGSRASLNQAHSGLFVSDLSLKAKFTKAVPSSRAQSFYDQAAGFLYQMGFNEKLSWDLIPWSWLIDWSGNIGACIENAAAFNQMNGRFSMQYAWVTRRTTYSAVSPTYVTEDRYFKTRVTGGRIDAVFQERTHMSPFGPSFVMPTLSSYQWSILVALGLARRA